jgi:hypothetical protein
LKSGIDKTKSNLWTENKTGTTLVKISLPTQQVKELDAVFSPVD